MSLARDETARGTYSYRTLYTYRNKSIVHTTKVKRIAIYWMNNESIVIYLPCQSDVRTIVCSSCASKWICPSGTCYTCRAKITQDTVTGGTSIHRVIVTFRIPSAMPQYSYSIGISRIEPPARDKFTDNGHRSAINQINQVKRRRRGVAGRGGGGKALQM